MKQAVAKQHEDLTAYQSFSRFRFVDRLFHPCQARRQTTQIARVAGSQSAAAEPSRVLAADTSETTSDLISLMCTAACYAPSTAALTSLKSRVLTAVIYSLWQFHYAAAEPKNT